MRNTTQEIEGVTDEVVGKVVTAFTVGVYGDNAEAGDETREEGTRQPLLLGLPEVEYLQKKARAICAKHPDDAEAAGEIATGLLVTDDKIKRTTGNAKRRLRDARKAAEEVFGTEERWNFEAFRKSTELPGGLVGALFGRMVTSDPGANIEAAVHVSHAFTVHAGRRARATIFPLWTTCKTRTRTRARRTSATWS